MSAIKAGQAYVEISTQKGLFDKGLAAVQKSMKSFANSAKFVGGGVAAGVGGAQKALGAFSSKVFNLKNALVGSFAVAGIAKLVSNFADAGSAIDDMSQRTGMTAESISALGYAAKLSGSSIEDVEKASRTLGKTIVAAADGNKAASETFKALGLSVEQIKGMSPEQQFLALSEQISKIPDQATKATTAMKVFGKSGASLLPMMAEGSKGIEDMMTEAGHMGQVMSGEDASAAASLGDALDVLWGSIGAVSNAIGATLAPMILGLVDEITGYVVAVVQWIDRNREMIVVAAQVAAGIAVAGAALLAIAGTAAVVSAALSGLIAVAGAVGVAFSVMGTIIAAVLSPIGLVVVGIAALGAAILYYSGAGGAMIGYLGEQFQGMLDFVMPVIDAIKEALMSGQWAAAGKVLFTALEIAFRTGTQTLYGIWLDTGVAMQNLWTDIWGAMTDNFGNIINGVIGLWDSAVNSIAKSLLYLYSLFDRSVNYEAAANQMDTDTQQRKKDRDKTGFASKDDREKVKQERRDQSQEKKDSFAGRIDDLKDQLAESVEEIYKVSAEKAAAAEQENKGPKLPTLGNINMPSLDAVKEKTKSTDVSGTFSGFAAGLMGGGVSTFDRMLDETKKTNELLADVVDNTDDMGIELGA